VSIPDPVGTAVSSDHEETGPARKPRARYRFGFFARYLRQFVLAKMDAEGWRQYEVAEWLDMPQHALSEYLNRHTHPSPDRRAKLLRLGCQAEELDRAEFADKLEWWMKTHGMAADDVVDSLEFIQTYEREMRFAKVTMSGLSASHSRAPSSPRREVSRPRREVARTEGVVDSYDPRR